MHRCCCRGPNTRFPEILPWTPPVQMPAVDENRRSAVHFAAAMGKAQLVQRLLAAGGEVDLADKEGAWHFLALDR